MFKSWCVSVKEWSKCDKLKVCSSHKKIKKMYKNKVINNYMTQYQ